MALKVRRVVTGHDAKGKAVVTIDDVNKHVVSGRPGHSSVLVWTTEGFPVDNTGGGDAAAKTIGTTIPNGTVCRVIEFGPGVAPRDHRTDSVDYIIVMAGEIDMELEGSTVHLKAGDVLVQRGTIHNWVNRGSQPCVVAAVLVDAKPVTVGGRTLNAVG